MYNIYGIDNKYYTNYLNLNDLKSREDIESDKLEKYPKLKSLKNNIFKVKDFDTFNCVFNHRKYKKIRIDYIINEFNDEIYFNKLLKLEYKKQRHIQFYKLYYAYCYIIRDYIYNVFNSKLEFDSTKIDTITNYINQELTNMSICQNYSM